MTGILLGYIYEWWKEFTERNQVSHLKQNKKHIKDKNFMRSHTDFLWDWNIDASVFHSGAKTLTQGLNTEGVFIEIFPPK